MIERHHIHLHLQDATGSLRTATLQGRDHLVVPVTALVEGVIRPRRRVSQYVPASSLSALGWDGRPVMRGHPSGPSGSANDPRTLESWSFGTVFNTTVRNGRLEMEAWLDPQRAARVMGAERIIERLRNHETVEVSVSGHITLEERAGEYNGQPYDAVWYDYMIPDHLAFLDEDKIGACSIEMGCGALRHSVTAQGIFLTKTKADACSCTREGTHMKNEPKTTSPTPRDVITPGDTRSRDARVVEANVHLAEARLALLRSNLERTFTAPTVDDTLRAMREGRSFPLDVPTAGERRSVPLDAPTGIQHQLHAGAYDPEAWAEYGRRGVARDAEAAERAHRAGQAAPPIDLASRLRARVGGAR